MSNWHTRTVEDIVESLRSDAEKGLRSEDVPARRSVYGENVIPEGKSRNLFFIFLDQFRSPLVYILFVACAIVFWVGEYVDAAVIFGVILINSFIGTVQEGRAEKTLQALKRFIETEAAVVRDGEETLVPDREIVPGDVLVLREGDKVPADARIMESVRFKVNESALTGESGAVEKSSVMMGEKNASPSDRKNVVFKGTSVVSGTCRAIAVETGLDTELGRISSAIAAIDTEIPLKKDIRNFSKMLVVGILVALLFLFGFGVFLGEPLEEMFIMIVSLAVSIVPEGLPAMLTIVLARGVWRMAKRNALVKRLQAIEALGQARVIAVDKTGTITRNEMVVKRIFAGGIFFDVSGAGYEPKGDVLAEGKDPTGKEMQEFLFAARIAASGIEAHAVFSDSSQTWKTFGDPTEVALAVLGEKFGFPKKLIDDEDAVFIDIPFDHETKYHAVFRERKDGSQFVTVIGAPETVLPLCKKIRKNEAYEPLTGKETEKIEEAMMSMSSDGMRMLAAATYEIPNGKKEKSVKNINNFSFVALYGIEDSLRENVRESVNHVLRAGIRVVMITGDHKLTAVAIAKSAGIYKEGDEVLVGEDLRTMSNEELREKLPRTSVFARVTPEHKLSIIQAYRDIGEIVAMTGDGVNDAPSLVAADLGVSMGRTGTEVAKEASDIIILDDNIGTIVSAVEEGRSIFKTVQRVILYLFSTNLAELLVILGALAIGFPLPILPTQIIWLNLVTDGFFTVSLAMEPKEKGLLSRAFVRSKNIFTGSMFVRSTIMAVPMIAGTLFLFGKYFEMDLVRGMTVTFTTLAVFQWFNAWNCRTEEKSIFFSRPFSNPYLFLALFLSIGCQFLAVYHPFFQKILRTTALSLRDWGVVLLVSTSVIIVEEARKAIVRRSSSRK